MSYQRVLEAQLQRQADRILAALADLSPPEFVSRPQGLASILWQVGHLGLSDKNLLKRVPAPVEIPEGYNVLFGRGSGNGSLPPTEVVLALFRDAHAGLLGLAVQDLERPLASPTDAYRTVGAGLMSMVHHRGYHYGKIMTLRALLGKARLLG